MGDPIDLSHCEPDALFKCNNGRLHGTHRRDQLPTERGRLDCYQCRREGIRANLEYVGRESLLKEAE
jgi:hypothetical protein